VRIFDDPAGSIQHFGVQTRYRHPTLTHPPWVLKRGSAHTSSNQDRSRISKREPCHGLWKTTTRMPARLTEKPKVESLKLDRGFFRKSKMGQKACWMGYQKKEAGEMVPFPCLPVSLIPYIEHSTYIFWLVQLHPLHSNFSLCFD
jgi:hypothetical protein